MSVPRPFTIDDDLDFRESLQADAETMAARGFASNFCAAWLAFWRWSLIEYGEQLEQAYALTSPDKQPKTGAKIIASVSRSCMALISAAVRADKTRSQKRRFKCSSWMLESYRAGLELISDDIGPEDAKKMRANLSRYWRGHFSLLHLFECVTQLALFPREAKDWRANREKHESAAYTDQASELLFEVMDRGGWRRGLSRVRVFEMAVADTVENFRKRHGDYAPGYVMPEPRRDSLKRDGEPKTRAKVISFDRAKEKLLAGVEMLSSLAEAGQLTPERADEIVLILAPVVALANRGVSAKVKDGVSLEDTANFKAEKSTPVFDTPKCEFPAKNEKQTFATADVFIRTNSPENSPLDVPAFEFLSAFYPDPHEPVRLRMFGPKGTPDEPRFRPEKIPSRRAKLATDARHVEELQKRNQTRGLYFVVNAGGDDDASIVRVNAFFAEMDEGSLAEQHAKFDDCPIPPGVRVETLKSVHAYWLAAPGCSIEQWRDVQRRLIHHFGSDPKIKNPSRVMRLPGFNHVSYRDGLLSYKPVEVVAFDPSRRFSPGEMLAAFPAVPEAKPKRTYAPKTISDLSGDFEAYKRELGARIGNHETARRNGRGNWDCRAICHEGKGSSGLFYDPSKNFAWCNSGCDLSKIAAAFGLSPHVHVSGAAACNGRVRGTI